MKTILRSHELSCPSCVNNIESSLNQAEGVTEATVHFATGRIEITHDADTIAADELQEMVQKTGYETTISKF
jgi:copper chaperone CopZ